MIRLIKLIQLLVCKCLCFCCTACASAISQKHLKQGSAVHINKKNARLIINIYLLNITELFLLQKMLGVYIVLVYFSFYFQNFERPIIQLYLITITEKHIVTIIILISINLSELFASVQLLRRLFKEVSIYLTCA